MALEFPLSAADFLDRLPVREVRFDLFRPQAITGLAGGEILRAALAPAYWRGSVALAPMAKRQAAEVQALLHWLEDQGGAFHVHKPHQIGPAADPLGAGLAGFSPLLEAVAGDPRQVKVGGLPQGYEISAGDFLAFDYDVGATTRRALHQVVRGAPANVASGLSDYTQTGFLHVTPHLRPPYATGGAVALVKPSALAVLVPGSVSAGITSHNVTSGMSFEFRQTLRGY